MGPEVTESELDGYRQRKRYPDGPILRYDSAHQDTKGHERHEAPEKEAEYIEFTGIVELYERFWSEIPKAPIEPS